MVQDPLARMSTTQHPDLLDLPDLELQWNQDIELMQLFLQIDIAMKISGQ